MKEKGIFLNTISLSTECLWIKYGFDKSTRCSGGDMGHEEKGSWQWSDGDEVLWTDGSYMELEQID